jgi:hypothetical protein
MEPPEYKAEALLPESPCLVVFFFLADKNFFRYVQTGCGAYPAPCPMGTRDSADHIPPASVVKTVWNSIPPFFVYAFLAWYLGTGIATVRLLYNSFY